MGETVGSEENDVISVHSASESSTAASGDDDTLSEDDSILGALTPNISRGATQSTLLDGAARVDNEVPPVDHGVASLKLTKAPAAKKAADHTKRRVAETSPDKTKRANKKKRVTLDETATTEPAAPSLGNGAPIQNGTRESSGQPRRIRRTPNEGVEAEQQRVQCQVALSRERVAAQKRNADKQSKSSNLKGEESTEGEEPHTLSNEKMGEFQSSSASSKGITKEWQHHELTEQIATANTKNHSSRTMNGEVDTKSTPKVAAATDPSYLPDSAVTKADSTLDLSEDKPRKKLTFDEQLLSHMRLSFKPFTLKTLALELQSTETIVNFSMLSMVDKNLVIKKEFPSSGGNKIKTLYWANHGVSTKDMTTSCQALPEEIEATKLELVQVSNQNMSLHRDLAAVKETLSNEELESQLNREQSQLDEILKQLADTKDRINSLTGQRNATANFSGRKVPPKFATGSARESCPRRLKMRINNMRSEWITRKQKCSDFIENLADGLEKKPKDVVKLLDIESDEMVGVKVPLKRVIDAACS